MKTGKHENQTRTRRAQSSMAPSGSARTVRAAIRSNGHGAKRISARQPAANNWRSIGLTTSAGGPPDLPSLSDERKIKREHFTTGSVAVIGLGYVGLPLSLQFARSGANVLGLDIDPQKVNSINVGQSYIKHIESGAIAQQLASKSFRASTDFSEVRSVDAVIICVPTPLNKNREPDISYIIKTGESIAPHLHKGILVVLESTTYPGTTDEDLRIVLEAGSGLKAGADFHLAFSPEREDPGNALSKVEHVPKVIGG